MVDLFRDIAHETPLGPEGPYRSVARLPACGDSVDRDLEQLRVSPRFRQVVVQDDSAVLFRTEEEVRQVLQDRRPGVASSYQLIDDSLLSRICAPIPEGSPRRSIPELCDGFRAEFSIPVERGEPLTVSRRFALCRSDEPAVPASGDQPDRYNVFLSPMRAINNPSGLQRSAIPNVQFTISEVLALTVYPDLHNRWDSFSTSDGATIGLTISDSLLVPEEPTDEDIRGPLARWVAGNTEAFPDVARRQEIVDAFNVAGKTTRNGNRNTAVALDPPTTSRDYTNWVVGGLSVATGLAFIAGMWGKKIAGYFTTTRRFHTTNLDNFTVDITETARSFVREYDRLRASAENTLDTSLTDLSDRARGVARAGLASNSNFSEYIGVDELLHSIELGLRSSDPDERGAAESLRRSIQEAEGILGADRLASPLFIAGGGAGKTTILRAIVLRAIRGVSSNPSAMAGRLWRVITASYLSGGTPNARLGEEERGKWVGNLGDHVKWVAEALSYFHRRGIRTTLLGDEAHTLLCPTDPHLAEAMQGFKPPMADGNAVSLMGATTPAEDQIAERDSAFSQRVPRVRLDGATPAGMRLAVQARLYTKRPEALSQKGIRGLITHLIDLSYQMEGQHSPRHILDGALASILRGNESLTTENIGQYFRAEGRRRIDVIVNSVAENFRTVALQRRLNAALGYASEHIDEQEVRRSIAPIIHEAAQRNKWLPFVDANAQEVARAAFARAMEVVGGVFEERQVSLPKGQPPTAATDPAPAAPAAPPPNGSPPPPSGPVDEQQSVSFQNMDNMDQAREAMEHVITEVQEGRNRGETRYKDFYVDGGAIDAAIERSEGDPNKAFDLFYRAVEESRQTDRSGGACVQVTGDTVRALVSSIQPAATPAASPAAVLESIAVAETPPVADQSQAGDSDRLRLERITDRLRADLAQRLRGVDLSRHPRAVETAARLILNRWESQFRTEGRSLPEDLRTLPEERLFVEVVDQFSQEQNNLPELERRMEETRLREDRERERDILPEERAR